jgi:maltooligosyltrehalose synthase
MIAIAPRLIADLLGDMEKMPLGPQVWDDTRVLLRDAGNSRCYRNLFTGETLQLQESGEQRKLDVSKILAEFPVALLVSD